MSCRGISKRIWRCDGGEPLSWRYCWCCLNGNSDFTTVIERKKESMGIL